MRQYFASNGLGDIEFVIVNAKYDHSRLMYGRLAELVSFSVWQDTEEEDVWGKMQGDKDDIYIYDRCGRLAFYIPYPLSVMTTSDSLVPKAIVATYFGSPCNSSCEYNSTLTRDSKNGTIETTTLINTVAPLINDENSTDINNSSYVDVNATLIDTYSNDTNNIINNNNNTEFENTSSHLNNILHFFHNSSENHTSHAHHNAADVEGLVNDVLNSITDHNHLHGLESNNETAVPDHHSHHGSVEHTKREAPQSDRCKEADVQVCKDFTKKKLLRIQTCCLLGKNQKTRSCQPFTRRKCKKLKMVIKCCIRTSLSEETTTDEPTTDETTVTEPTTPSSVMCCRDTFNGKVCRRSEPGTCDYNVEYEELDRRFQSNDI